MILSSKSISLLFISNKSFDCNIFSHMELSVFLHFCIYHLMYIFVLFSINGNNFINVFIPIPFTPGIPSDLSPSNILIIKSSSGGFHILQILCPHHTLFSLLVNKVLCSYLLIVESLCLLIEW